MWLLLPDCCRSVPYAEIPPRHRPNRTKLEGMKVCRPIKARVYSHPFQIGLKMRKISRGKVLKGLTFFALIHKMNIRRMLSIFFSDGMLVATRVVATNGIVGSAEDQPECSSNKRMLPGIGKTKIYRARHRWLLPLPNIFFRQCHGE